MEWEWEGYGKGRNGLCDVGYVERGGRDGRKEREV